MGYSKRDLRAADMLALIFVGLGLALFAYGVVDWVGAKGGAKPGDAKNEAKLVAPDQAAPDQPAAPAEPKDGEKAAGEAEPPDLLPFVLGSVFVALGAALHFKVRQLQRSGGEEPTEA